MILLLLLLLLLLYIIQRRLQQQHQQQQVYGGKTSVRGMTSGTASSIAFTPLQVCTCVCIQCVYYISRSLFRLYVIAFAIITFASFTLDLLNNSSQNRDLKFNRI